MKVLRRRSNRRTVLVCARCWKVFKTYIPEHPENGRAPTLHARVGVCPVCRAATREWIYGELSEGRKLDTT